MMGVVTVSDLSFSGNFAHTIDPKGRVTIPAAFLSDYQGQILQFSLRGYNRKDILGTLSVYAAPASATIQ